MESIWMGELDEAEKKLKGFDFGKESEDDLEEDPAQSFVQCLHAVCQVVRRADSSGAPDLETIVERAAKVLNVAVFLAYGQADLFDFLPSFSHDDETAPMVEDTLQMPLGQGMMDTFMTLFKGVMKEDQTPDGAPLHQMPGPGRWDKTTQLHSSSTRLSRFRTGIIPSLSPSFKLANTLYQAHCEITDTNICLPSRIAMSPDGSCLAVLAAGGWKNRDPVVHCYHLGEDAEDADSLSLDPGLCEVAYSLAVDDTRKLIWVGDSYRVKAFSYDDGTGHLIHTLNSEKAAGAIAVLPNGRVLRAGRGFALVWDVDQLERHVKGTLIGGKFTSEGSRDNDNGLIEMSQGSTHHATIKFSNVSFAPYVWELHRPSGRMLCAESGRKTASYGVAMIDLEHDGAIISRYIGHGGDAENLSMSEGDPNVFATAGSDGYARLYDIRHPLPVLTLDSGRQSEACNDVVFVHPDGVPTLFSAGDTSEQIKLWDIRARAMVYELGTGNNSVASIAWDAADNTLYAATQCCYVDRLGYHHDYRPAHIPRWAEETPLDDPVEEDSDGWGDEDDTPGFKDEDDDFYDSEEDEERCWPINAYHGEDFYGYALDAGEHRLYRYAFKDDADPAILPIYGQANMRGAGSYW